MKKAVSMLMVLVLAVSVFCVPAQAVSINDLTGAYYWVEGNNDASALKNAADSGVRFNITADGIGTLVVTSGTSIIKFYPENNKAVVVHLDANNTELEFTYDRGVLTVGNLVFKKASEFTVEEAFGIEPSPQVDFPALKDNPAPVGYWSTWTDSIGTSWVQISHPVYNDGNTDLFLSSGTVELEDSSGHLLDTMNMVSAYPQVIRPGETGWYYGTKICDQASSVAGFVAHTNAKQAKVKCIRLDVDDVSIRDDMWGGVSVTGRVVNNTGEEQSVVYVVAFLYNNDGAIISQPMTIISDKIAAGGRMGFTATEMANLPNVTAASVASYDIYAFPYQFQFG